MNLIQNLTDDFKQDQNLILPDGTTMSMSIEYKPQQLGWFITQLIYQTFEVDNIRICTSPNILRQFKNLIPFGLACFTTGNAEPTTQEDFLSGRSQLYLLTSDEVIQFEHILTGALSA